MSQTSSNPRPKTVPPARVKDSRSVLHRRSVHVWMPGLGENKGGIQAFSAAFVTALSEHLHERRMVLFLKNDRRCPSNLDADCRVFGRIPEGPVRTGIYTAAMWFSVVRQRPSLIIVGHANFTPVAAWITRWLHIPFWVVVHGIEVWDDNGRRQAKNLKLARRVLSVSRFTRDQLVRQSGLDIAKISLMPNTFDPKRFRPGERSPELLRDLGLHGSGRIILTICRLAEAERYKGYDQIIRAMPEILRAVPEAHYLIGGHGKDASRIRKLIAELHLEQHVTLAGFIPDEKMTAFYNLCDVFAMPSKLEGFGIVFLEALACGRPVLAGNQDGAVDALCNGELGVLVNPDRTDLLANSLIDILTKTHAHPLIYQPDELRRRVLAAYGPHQFSATVGRYLRDFFSSESEEARY